MPAHTAEAHIGVKTLSDGTVLSRIDRSMNNEADRLAKAAAMSGRVPAWVRAAVVGELGRLEAIARWIGQATAIANSWKLEDGRIVRDSAPPTGRLRRKQPHAKRKASAPEPLLVRGLPGCGRWQALLQRVRAKAL